MQQAACAAIKEVHDRYTSFVKKMHPLDLAAGCPDAVRTYYVTLATLHERCVQLPTKVYALNLEPAQNDAWNMVLTSMTAESVGTIMMPCDGPLNPWQLLPQPFYSIAADGNLYTFQDFVTYYGIARASKLNPNHPLTQTLPLLFPTFVKTFAKT